MGVSKRSFVIAFLTIVLAALLALSLAGCSQGSAPKSSDETATGMSESDGEMGAVASGINIEIVAEGYDAATSTPCVIGLFTETEDDVKTTYSFEHCNAQVVIDCEEGEYTLNVIPPINKDGSTYRIPQTIQANSTGSAEWEKNPLKIELELLSPDEATAEDISDILSAYENALDSSDLQEMERSDAMDLANANAAANPNFRAAYDGNAADSVEQDEIL